MKLNLKKIARRMRNKPTQAEALFAEKLRYWGIKYKSQWVIDYYCADFYLPEYRTVVEIDGTHHYQEKNLKKDGIRTAFIASKGFNVIRLPNREVYPLKKDELLAHLSQEVVEKVAEDGLGLCEGRAKYYKSLN